MIRDRSQPNLRVTPQRSAHQQISILAAILVIASLGAYYWQFLPTGSISRFDEYLTFDRSFNIIRHQDWFTIYLMDEPNFSKPPLHYWLTALAMEHSSDLEFALRIWPFMEGLMLLFCVGVLAYVLKPSTPFVLLLAVVLASGSRHLWALSTSAMLDTGDALFLTMTLISLLLSLRDPRYWYLVAFSIALGALQKSPINLLMVIYVLTVLQLFKRHHGMDIAEVVRNKHFKIAIPLAFLSVIIWPLVQVARYDFSFMEHYYSGQILQRFAPSFGSHKVSFIKLLEWVVRPNPLCITLSLILLPWAIRFVDRVHAIVMLSVVIAFFVLMTLASGQIFHRYTLLIEPIFYAYLAVLVILFVPNIKKALVLSITAVLLTGSPLIGAKGVHKSQLEKFYPLLETYKGMVRPADRLVLCQFETGVRFVHPVAFKHFATDHRSFKILSKADDLKHLEGTTGRILGLCTVEHYKKIKSGLKHPTILHEDVGHLIWRSD